MNIKLYISACFKTIALLLALTVLLPSAVKLSHVFNHHQHEVCESDSNLDTHFHEHDLDCEFYKFKISTQYYTKIKPSKVLEIQENFKITDSQYESISDFQRLQTTLRGPPAHS